MSINCYDYLLDSYKKNGDYAAAITFGNKISFSKLMFDIDAIAGYMDSIGVKRGDTVTVFLPTLVHAFTSFYALNKIGVIANIVHPLTSPEGLLESIKTTDARITSGGCLSQMHPPLVFVFNSLFIRSFRRKPHHRYPCFSGSRPCPYESISG